MYIITSCPQCGDETDHEVLKEAADLLVRCAECGTVHHVPKPNETILNIRTIVSSEAESTVCTIELLEEDVISVGDYLVAECGEEGVSVEVTSIECGERRVQKAAAPEISTLWTREIEEVVVRASVHKGWKTFSLYQRCDGEEPFAVGEVYSFGNVRFRISHIKMREGQVLRKDGWKTVAKKIRRIYGNRL
ncbi:HVO_0476 family zinc finger protein [Methanofollis fontis]|uniref:Zn-finger protein n=1 Tax=Methanofollis fontis TaxID=2052832 RepID=A0A483CRL3_9EURY|nr:HVO_0476 family zinc finger protein [Methanofollis fontis]TAJ44831.1 hypothetical protein CUJ86_05940 [Methanofollis fontis]